MVHNTLGSVPFEVTGLDSRYGKARHDMCVCVCVWLYVVLLHIVVEDSTDDEMMNFRLLLCSSLRCDERDVMIEM